MAASMCCTSYQANNLRPTSAATQILQEHAMHFPMALHLHGPALDCCQAVLHHLLKSEATTPEHQHFSDTPCNKSPTAHLRAPALDGSQAVPHHLSRQQPTAHASCGTIIAGTCHQITLHTAPHLRAPALDCGQAVLHHLPRQRPTANTCCNTSSAKIK
jgi:hypothetical protein